MQRGSQLLEYIGHGIDRRRKHDELGTARGLRRVPYLIDPVSAKRKILSIFTPAGARHGGGDAVVSGRRGDRSTDQPESDHCDPLKERLHKPPSRSLRNVLTKRSFSSGSPMLMRM